MFWYPCYHSFIHFNVKPKHVPIKTNSFYEAIISRITSIARLKTNDQNIHIETHLFQEAKWQTLSSSSSSLKLRQKLKTMPNHKPSIQYPIGKPKRLSRNRVLSDGDGGDEVEGDGGEPRIRSNRIRAKDLSVVEVCGGHALNCDLVLFVIYYIKFNFKRSQ